MNRERLDGWCERGILVLVLAVLVFGPLAMGAVGVWQLLVLEGLTLGVLALWALRIWISPKPQLLFPPICWVVLAFVGVCGSSGMSRRTSSMWRWGIVPRSDLRVPFLRDSEQSAPPGTHPDHGADAGVPGHGDFVLRDLSIRDEVNAGLGSEKSVPGPRGRDVSLSEQPGGVFGNDCAARVEFPADQPAVARAENIFGLCDCGDAGRHWRDRVARRLAGDGLGARRFLLRAAVATELPPASRGAGGGVDSERSVPGIESAIHAGARRERAHERQHG